MRTLVCGDIHCKPWLLDKAISTTKWDKFVFLGDACDNWGASQEDNIDILSKLITYKKEYGENFVWLLGNHDWGYYDDTIKLTGHILRISSSVRAILEESIDLWDLFYSDGKYIYSHAGISSEFLAETRNIGYKELKTRRGYSNPLNNVGAACAGSSPVPSLLWARPQEIHHFPLDEQQIVGHTPVESIQYVNGLLVCDTMSQYPDGRYIGDKALLLIEDDEKWAISSDTGRKMYEL